MTLVTMDIFNSVVLRACLPLKEPHAQRSVVYNRLRPFSIHTRHVCRHSLQFLSLEITTAIGEADLLSAWIKLHRGPILF